MAIAVKDNTVYAVEIEDTENTYKAPTADTSYVQTLSDGAEMTPAKELLERNIFNGSIGKTTARTGTRTVTGSMPVEMRAAATTGEAPEYDALLRAALGLRRQVTTTSADDTDAGGPHTTSRIYLLDADASKYAVGDMVTVQVTGDYHTSPVSAVSNTPGDVYIDLLVAADNPFTDGDAIAAVTTYVTANSGQPSLSISKYLETTVLEQATGCRVNSMALENFTTGQLASWNFGFEGMDFDRSLTSQPHTPAYSSAEPPIILQACVYQDGVQLQVNELSFSIENTLGFATSTCSENGRISGRVTERTISGSLNPYKQDDSIAQFTRFKTNTEFSLFGSAIIPSSTAGEYAQVVSFYLPSCIVTELGEADQDGLLQEEVSFSAGRGANGTDEEIYISFS
jgi:hypothetical protein